MKEQENWLRHYKYVANMWRAFKNKQINMLYSLWKILPIKVFREPLEVVHNLTTAS
jgi:hypothetical protein